MILERGSEQLLGLSDGWEVKRVELDTVQGEVAVHIECGQKELADPFTQVPCKVYDHPPVRRWRHLETMRYKTYLSCALPRIELPDGKVKTVDPPWASSHERHTYLFEHLMIDLLNATGDQTRSAKLLRCGFNVVNRIVHLSVRRGMTKRPLGGAHFTHLSADEKSFKNGHKCGTVLSDPFSGRVLDVEEDRTKEACKNVLDRALTTTQQQQVRTVTMDMWKAHITTAIERLPQARIIHDRFHLVKYLNTALNQVLRREAKTHSELKQTRYTLLKNPENLTEKQRIKFEHIKAANFEVARAWQTRENFKDLFSSSALRRTADQLYMQWASDTMNRKITELSKVVVMFNARVRGMLNALASPLSSAMAERPNRKIQQLKSVGRGYRTFANFRSAILFFHGGLNLYPL